MASRSTRTRPGPHKGKSAAEVVLTVLHAGGKFGGSGYKVSGGLHGVGVSVVNALVQRLVARGRPRRQPLPHGVRQGRQAAGQARGRRPVAAGPHRHHGHVLARSHRLRRRPSSTPAPCSSGCRRWPSSTRAWRSASATSGPSHEQEVTYKYSGGIVDFVKHLNAAKESLFTKVALASTGEEDDQQVEVALQWNTGFYEGIHGYANGIATIEGGMHVEGFKSALTRVVNKYARSGKQPLLKEKDDNLLGEDIREGLTAIISVKLREPQFEGQTKAKLGNVSIRSLVQKATNDKLAEWLLENPTEANRVVKKAIAAAQARVAAKNARNVIRRKTGLSGAGMPDKLKDCSSQRPARERAVHRRGRLGRRHRGARPAIRRPRPSCRSAARS